MPPRQKFLMTGARKKARCADTASPRGSAHFRIWRVLPDPAAYFDLSDATRFVSSPIMIALAGSPASSTRIPSACPIRG